jgi:phospholipase/carboxylesterase
MHVAKLLITGLELQKASKAIILLHGRGGSANDIISLADHFALEGFVILAPEATDHSWYPQSFLVPVAKNEPWLTSALLRVKEIVDYLTHEGFLPEQIYFAGFSQGACLTLEFVARNAARWGGVIAYTGGLIGEQLVDENYVGDFQQTPILIASSDPDEHVPPSRVHETVSVLRKLNAQVTEKIFSNMGHTIIQEEIDLANELIFFSYQA